MAADDDQLALFPDLPDAARLRLSRSRLFFALWPDRGLRAGIEQAAALIPPGDAATAVRVRPERYHLTLAFLGELDTRQIAAAMQAGDSVQVPAFDLMLDQVGHFSTANVAWIGPGRLDPALAKLKAELDRELLHHCLPVSSEPFVPHVTCLRKIREAPDAPPPALRWSVTDFVLARSARDASGKPAGYKVLKRWPLSPG